MASAAHLRWCQWRWPAWPVDLESIDRRDRCPFVKALRRIRLRMRPTDPAFVARQRLALALSLQGNRSWLAARRAQLLEEERLLDADALLQEFRGLGQPDQLLTVPAQLG